MAELVKNTSLTHLSLVETELTTKALQEIARRTILKELSIDGLKTEEEELKPYTFRQILQASYKKY